MSDAPYLHPDVPDDDASAGGGDVASRTPRESGVAGTGLEAPALDDVSVESPEDERIAELMAHTIDVAAFAPAVEAQDPVDAADTLEELATGDAADVVHQMDDVAAAQGLTEMDAALAVRVLQDLSDEHGPVEPARYIDLMDPDDAVDLLQTMEEGLREGILRTLPSHSVITLRRLSTFDPESAGGMMTTEFVSIPNHVSVGDAVDLIRHHPVRKFEHVYVLDDANRLVGVVSCRKLLINEPEAVVDDIMHHHVDVVRPEIDREEIVSLFDRYDYTVMPVVDRAGHLLGVVTVDDVIDVIRAENTEDTYKMVGAGKEEAVYSGLGEKLKGRFPWLMINLVTSFLAASVVLRFEGLIGDLAVLAVLMPMIANLAGNAGQQSLAISLRGLVLGEIRSTRVWPLIWREMTLGILTGLGLGVVMGVIVAGLGMMGLSSGASWRLGVVVAVSMSASLAVGCLVGTGIPLLMQRLKADPATASTIFLTAVTDFTAFFTFLGLAFLLQGFLTG